MSAASPHVKPSLTDTCTADPALAGAGAAPIGDGVIVTIVAASTNTPISAAKVDRIVFFEKCPMMLSIADLLLVICESAFIAHFPLQTGVRASST